ncbi:MAG TPA: alkaline phosphatase family protein [Vicinamibacteria bacterium]|nr:alkaline phosphatase family protein [Vicinamibacteria bacterium]
MLHARLAAAALAGLALLGCRAGDRPVRGLWSGQARVEGTPPTRVVLDGEARCLLLRHRASDLRVRIAGTAPGGALNVRALQADREAPRPLATVTLPLARGAFRSELRFSRSELGQASWISLAFDRGGLAFDAFEPLEDAGGPRIVVFGLDGLSWRILDPLVNAGRLPNIAALIRQGSAGPLLSVKPTLSPVVWTTIASGHGPRDHGIWDFVDAQKHLVNSTQVRTKRIWELLSERSPATLGVVGWFVTWPVERVAGFMVSERSRPWKLTRERRPLSFHPPALQDPFEDVDRERRGSYFAESARFTSLPLDPEWRTKLADGTPERERMDALERRFLRAYLRDSTYAETGLSFYRALAPDLLFLYFRGVDHAQHAYWFARAPEESIDPVSEEDRRHFGGLIDSYYAYMDEVIGRYRGAAPEGTAFMVVSDHGFRSFTRQKGERRRSVAYHEREGVYVASGGSFKKGLRGEELSVLDLVPLWLHLAGLPAARDMPGRVPTQILASSRKELERVATYGRREAREESRSTEEDADLIEQFKALGYLGE